MFDPRWDEGCRSCSGRVDQYRTQEELAAAGFPGLNGEFHGTSAFLRDGERVFHTYSTYARGTEQVGGTHYYLDMTCITTSRGA